MPEIPDQTDNTEVSRPEWFAAFLADRGTRKPSADTLKAYRQDFDARGRFRVLVGSQQCAACGIHRTFRCRFCDAVVYRPPETPGARLST
jgi:hypothetical protein